MLARALTRMFLPGCNEAPLARSNTSESVTYSPTASPVLSGTASPARTSLASMLSDLSVADLAQGETTKLGLDDKKCNKGDKEDTGRCVGDERMSFIEQKIREWQADPWDRSWDETALEKVLEPCSPAVEISVPKYSSDICSSEELAKLMTFLPKRYQNSKLELVYSTETDGVGVHRFYDKVKGKSPTIMLIRDDNGCVFGTYTSCEWRSQRSYFGTGESFLFSFKNSDLKVFPWCHSCENRMFQLARPNMVAVGGGGNFGLYLDEEFWCGRSACCSTFMNEPLSGEEEFHCLVVECWHVVSSHTDV